jgi:2-keto-4-pentenoate hydratase/2-oxohepta-3-ene-1,7-dioic acid hydratase in catechol pathway
LPPDRLSQLTRGRIDALAGPDEDINIHPTARFLDYEGELCVSIGRECENLREDEDPLDYVLGYTAGNDVSSRYWQAAAISSSQAGYAKGFDQFAPIGPVISSTRVIQDPSSLTLTTHVNGEERQRTRTDDMIFDVSAIIRFISTGRTIRPGTVIMTGTPSGVVAGMDDKVWLKDGDTVEVTIQKIGRLRNKMVMKA